MIKLGLLVLLIWLIITMVLTLKNSKYVGVVFILQFLTIAIMFDYTKVNNEIQYKQFRDNNYTDFSNDKNYQHWLIDHPRKEKEM